MSIAHPAAPLYTKYYFDLNNLLLSNVGLELFSAHCTKELTRESLDFVLALHEYHAKLKQGQTSEQIFQLAQHVYKTFVVSGADKEVNLSGKIKAAIDTAMMQLPSNIALADTIFTSAQQASMLLLQMDVLPRFVRSEAFLAIVQHANEAKLVELGGKHVAQLMPVTCDHFERNVPKIDDWNQMVYLAQDHYRWTMLMSDPKTQDSIACCATSIVDDLAKQKHGDMKVAKMTCYVRGISAYELFSIAHSNPYLFKMVAQTIGYECVHTHKGSTAKEDFSYNYIKHTMKYMKLSSKRDFSVVSCTLYDPTRQCWLTIHRNCITDKIPKDSTKGITSTIRGNYITCIFVQHIDDTHCRYAQFNMGDMKGILQSFMDKLWLTWGKESTKGIHNVVNMYLKARTSEQIAAASDYTKPIPGLDDKFGILQAACDNYNNKHYFTMSN